MGRSLKWSIKSGRKKTEAPGFRFDYSAAAASGALVDVLEAHDVVLAQVAAGLHFDQVQRHLAGIFQPVVHADRDIGRLVFRQQLDALAAGDAGRAADHHPVLGAVVVHLQRQLAARIDGDALDLEALADVDALVAAPRTVDLGVVQMLGAVLRLQVFDDLLDALHLVLVGHQHGVGLLDDDHIFQADDGDDAALGAHQRARHAVQVDVAAGGVAGLIVRLHVPQRRPRTDVAPAYGRRHDDGVAGAFHDGIVDRVRRAGREGGFVEAAKIEVAVAQPHGRFGGAGHAGMEFLQLAQVAVGAEQEHAAVPVVIAGVDEALGRGAVRLLDEALDLEAGCGRRGGAALDVAIAGFRRRRHDAEGGQRAVGGHHGRVCYRLVERVDILDHVVGRQHQHHGVGVDGLDEVGGGGDGGRRVAPHRFEQDTKRCNADFTQLLGDHEAVFIAADHQGLHQARPAGQALRRVLQHGHVAYDGQQLLRQDRARQRPQTGAGTTRQDDWINIHALLFLYRFVAVIRAPLVATVACIGPRLGVILRGMLHVTGAVDTIVLKDNHFVQSNIC